MFKFETWVEHRYLHTPFPQSRRRAYIKLWKWETTFTLWETY